jgi:hypothetical protein
MTLRLNIYYILMSILIMEFGSISIQTATYVIILQRIIHENILKRIFIAEVDAWPIASVCNRHDDFGASTCSHF